MPERPLLVFPKPDKASRSSLGGGGGASHLPSHKRQGERLASQFQQLQNAIRLRNIEIQQTVTGIDPEQVLVMEIIGSVENFANAVKRISGFEWMGEFAIDEIAPDEDFFDDTNPDNPLNGRLYMMMTNQRALDEVLSMWRQYSNQEDPKQKFPSNLTKFRDVFLHLKSIRRWNVQDRLLETGVVDYWLADLEYDGDRVIPFEVELWFRSNSELRRIGENHVTNLVRQAGGQILSQSVIEGIGYHGLLAELPANAIRLMVDNPVTELVKCENIMFFRPVGQMVVGVEKTEGNTEITPVEETELPSGQPVVALFDGVPLTNHSLLAGRLIVDDPDNWAAEYAAEERIHGSSMASLIIHGDLNQPQRPLSRPIYARPIMKPLLHPDKPRPEGIPENCLAVDLIHRAVKRLFEGEQGEAPVSPHIRVINLSVCDRSRQFVQSMSPIARLLDWLSEKYRVLFVVSVGNHTRSIDLGVSRETFEAFQPNEFEAATIKSLFNDARHRRLLSPAETINGISVGAAHIDSSHVGYLANRVDPFQHLLPSPVSAFGSGYRRAIKPDMIFYGGRQLYRFPLQPEKTVSIEPAIFRTSPGNKVATLGKLPGELNATTYSCGTSNAAALISRAAGICYDSLQQILGEQQIDIDFSNYETPLLKAMLVHGCSWDEMGSHIKDAIRTAKNRNKLSGLIGRWAGYGIPKVDRVLDCTAQRATVLGFGQLLDNEAHVFSLPLPPSLGSRPEWRRLTVTLAWLSPITINTQKYRTAHLWFETAGIGLAKDRKEICGGKEGWRRVRRGTIQHEIFEGEKPEPFIDGDMIEIKVNCRAEAGKIQKPVSYGLMVTLEVAEGLDIAVYNEISTRIAPAIQIQQVMKPF